MKEYAVFAATNHISVNRTPQSHCCQRFAFYDKLSCQNLENGGERLESQNGYLSFRGLRVHYRVSRPDDGPVTRRVLLLNAPLSSMFNWRLLIPELLSQGCMVVQVDLPGYGLSACGGGVPQDPVTRARLVWGVLDDVDAASGHPAQFWHLIAHGSACLTALTMAHAVPEAVASEVLISPLLHTPVRPFYRRFPGNRLLEGRFQRWYIEHILSRQGMRELLREWFGRTVPDYVLDYMRRPLVRPGMKPQLRRLIAEGYDADPAVFTGFTPTMALWGQRDPLISAADAAHIRELMPGAEAHVLHTAAHFPQETHSRAIGDYLRGWLKFIDG